ncbi:MAG: sigma-70 family RNA polymerase sigma factor [Dehalococcoidia bacterium]|nr:sigma-70 family RNA polymerase sigma factor [Dehalococcoidia bacterium]
MTAPAASLFDEATLVRQAQGGDREAFAQLYDRYFERIYDFVRRTLRNEADAADVTQEVFIKAMASISTLSNPGVFKSWLFTVARNLSISRIRGARQVLSLDYAETDEPEATLSELVPDTDIAGAPEEAAERSELAAMVWAVAAGLDARQYTVLDLSVRQELDAAEMAEVLGVTRNNAYVMVNRTKAAFSESAGDYFIYRDGVQNCPGLREELARANIKAFSPEARKAIERHVKHCPRCGEKKKRLPLPLAMFSGLALAAPPEGLRERIRTSLVEWPGGLPPDAGGTGGSSGGPARRVALFAAAALGGLLLATLSGVATLSVLDDDDNSPPIEPPTLETTASTPAPSPATGSAAGSTGTPAGDPAGSPSPTAAGSPSAVATTGAATNPAATQEPASTSIPAPTPAATATSTSTPSPTATATATPSPTATATSSPTATPSPTATATPVPLQFSGLTQRCWVFPNGNLRVTVTVLNANGETLSGTATYLNVAANFVFNGNVGVAVIPFAPITTGSTANATVWTATRQLSTNFLVTSSGLCS